MAGSSQVASNRIWTIPNQITSVRLILAIGVFVAIAWHAFLTAIILFAIAAATDWVDGYWARKYRQVTKLGRIFDPFVDKIIICGTFIFLAAEDGSRIMPWMAVVVVGRELLVTALRGAIEQGGGDFSANMAGKWKMVFQCAAVIASMLLLWRHAESPGWLGQTATALVWLAVLSTLYSGAIYVRAACSILPKLMAEAAVDDDAVRSPEVERTPDDAPSSTG